MTAYGLTSGMDTTMPGTGLQAIIQFATGVAQTPWWRFDRRSGRTLTHETECAAVRS